MKIKVYVNGDKENVMTHKVESKKDLEKIVILAKSEVFRSDVLKDINYDEHKLIFKIDGEKISANKLVKMGLETLNSNKNDKSNGHKKGKKKKDKNNNKKKGKKKKSKKKNSSYNKYLDDGYIHMTRIDN